jgi:hypothetical protein
MKKREWVNPELVEFDFNETKGGRLVTFVEAPISHS